MTRFLESQGYIERIPVQGQRKDYFALPPTVAVTFLTSAQKSIQNLRGLFDRAAALAYQKGRPASPALEEASELFAFLADEYSEMLERWRARRASGAPTARSRAKRAPSTKAKARRRAP